LKFSRPFVIIYDMKTSTYSEWRSKFEAGEATLVELNDVLDDFKGTVADADAEAQAARARLDALKADLLALEGLRNFLAHDTGGTTVPPMRQAAPSARRSSKREAILSVLEDGQELHTRAIRQLLVSAGEMQPDQGSYHTLQVTLSQMYRAGELNRPARGVYGRPPTRTDGRPTGD
jgi:hypothetical protein